MLYVADVTPPEGDGQRWQTPVPMPISELVPALKAHGCSQDDIRKAFEEMGRQAYIRWAAHCEPLVQAALAGTREVPSQNVWVEAWIALALFVDKSPETIKDLLETADYINHAIPNEDVISWAFLRLRRRGWLVVQGNLFGLTAEGARSIEDIVGKDGGVLTGVERLSAWVVAHPS